ncbi:NAD(P)H-dependent glycerol-3-phosphate dehydrogenase [Porphyromonas crevioricanis]|uniref:Glycerol-3-phosphate dehydrogenase n=1 Tax=Porphyromonas crevioricanis TaxID=393921 RepID=A0AB34PIN4_9PORP|nr:NAD(P)H-dependent glycerol-3-phosphate dehydrogenase [Porphyromonas crevioricanis]KGN95073.1 glycerol-3-phosphate dehydrogenase [Porphyromonas crevioricanis]
MDSLGVIGILGSGSWATALAKIILGTQTRINWFVRRSEKIKAFQQTGHNPDYLTSVHFDKKRICFFSDSDLNAFFRASDTVVLVTPSPFIKTYLKRLRSSSLKDKLIINAIKGIVPDENILISDYLEHEMEIPRHMIGAVAGPCHAEEVAKNRLSYLTVGCFDKAKAELFAQALRTDFTFCAVSNDVVGIEYASVLKNVYAIAAGICNGLQYGDNFQSVLMSNAISEMNRFVNTVHLVDRDITDSVYLGDLLVTAYSQYSRNRTFGNMIGKGYSVKAAQMEMEMIAEGYYGAKCVREVNKRFRVNMPIMDTVYEILYEKRVPNEAITALTRHFK